MLISQTKMREAHDAPFVQARGLSLGDLRMQAYQDVDLDLEQGRAHAICAQDKGGKTELLLTLAGRMHPSKGSCTVDGNDVCTLRGMHAVRREASLSFFDHVNDVEMGLTVRTVASAELSLAGKRSNSAATRTFLSEWGLLEEADELVETLPRKTYDLLGIALAMAHDPKLLCVQDIERDLTEHESHQLCDLLRDLASKRGVTVICGVIDYDLGACFDTVTCITDETRAQQGAWLRRHQAREVA